MENQANLKTVTFGKYAGKRLLDVPEDYARFISSKGNKKFYHDWQKERRLAKHDLSKIDFFKSYSGVFLVKTMADGLRHVKLRVYNHNKGALANSSDYHFLINDKGEFVKDLHIEPVFNYTYK